MDKLFIIGFFILLGVFCFALVRLLLAIAQWFDRH